MFLTHAWMRLKSSLGGLLQQRDKGFPLRGSGHRQTWVVRPSVRKPPLGRDNISSALFLLYSMRDHGHKKDVMAEKELSQPRVPKTFSRNVYRIELLKRCGDGRREVLLCIRSTCQPFSKTLLLYR